MFAQKESRKPSAEKQKPVKKRSRLLLGVSLSNQAKAQRLTPRASFRKSSMIGAKMRKSRCFTTYGTKILSRPLRNKVQQWGNGNGNGNGRKPHKPVKKVKKEKTDREEIFEALQKLGHEPSFFELDGRPQSLHSLAKCDADLIFNLTESFDGDDTKEMNVVAYIDLLGLRFTGAGPHSLFMCQDKAIAKKIFAFHGIKTPFFRPPTADASSTRTIFLSR